MASQPVPVLPKPRRSEIWTTNLGNPPARHWILIVSLDSRNQSDRVDTILMIPFGSYGAEGPTTMQLQPGETGLPEPSWLKGHYINTFAKARLIERLPRRLSETHMRKVTAMIRRAFDPDAPWGKPAASAQRSSTRER
jgi:hypothetical protein